MSGASDVLNETDVVPSGALNEFAPASSGGAASTLPEAPLFLNETDVVPSGALNEFALASSGGSASTLPEAPLSFRIGLCTDVQHADSDDGLSFMGVKRYYRHSVSCVAEAVRSWCQLPSLACVLHLGDILDGLQAAKGRESSVVCLTRVLDAFSPLPVNVHHCVGNHCLTNLPRAELQARLGTPVHAEADGAAFYSFSPHPGFRIVVLDSYDVSLLGWEAGDARVALARELLEAHNPVNVKAGVVNSPDGLVGVERRWVGFGGGFSARQMAWLEGQLEAAESARERVFVALHTPLHPDSSPPVCLLWNYAEVLALLQRYRCVAATLAGHAHGGGFACCEAGIHHLVFPAMLECEPGTNAFGHLDVWQTGFAVVGTGKMANTELLPYQPWREEGESDRLTEKRA